MIKHDRKLYKFCLLPLGFILRCKLTIGKKSHRYVSDNVADIADQFEGMLNKGIDLEGGLSTSY